MKRYGLAITSFENSCYYTNKTDSKILPDEFDSLEDAQDKIVDIYLYAKMKAPLVNQRLFKNSVSVQNHKKQQFNIYIIKNSENDFKDISTNIIRERVNREIKKEWYEITGIQ